MKERMEVTTAEEKNMEEHTTEKKERKPREYKPKVLDGMRYMRALQVCQYLGGLGRTTLDSWIKRGIFPQGRLITNRCRVWCVDDVNAWIKSRNDEAA